MKRNIYFLNYASGTFIKAQKRNSLFVRIFLAPKGIFSYSKQDIDSEFLESYAHILSQKRGDGYWLWKPYFIHKKINQISDGSYLIYYDSGLGFRYLNFLKPLSIIDWMEKNGTDIFPGVAIPEYGKNELWTKADLFEEMGCDNPTCRNSPQIQATFCIFKVSPVSRYFVSRWLQLATVGHNITDSPSVRPNVAGFIEHRHDQSILTNLAYSMGLPVFNTSAIPYNKSLTFVELWLRSKNSITMRFFYKVILRYLDGRAKR